MYTAILFSSTFPSLFVQQQRETCKYGILYPFYDGNYRSFVFLIKKGNVFLCNIKYTVVLNLALCSKCNIHLYTAKNIYYSYSCLFSKHYNIFNYVFVYTMCSCVTDVFTLFFQGKWIWGICSSERTTAQRKSVILGTGSSL